MHGGPNSQGAGQTDGGTGTGARGPWHWKLARLVNWRDYDG